MSFSGCWAQLWAQGKGVEFTSRIFSSSSFFIPINTRDVVEPINHFGAGHYEMVKTSILFLISVFLISKIIYP